MTRLVAIWSSNVDSVCKRANELGEEMTRWLAIRALFRRHRMMTDYRNRVYDRGAFYA